MNRLSTPNHIDYTKQRQLSQRNLNDISLPIKAIQTAFVKSVKNPSSSRPTHLTGINTVNLTTKPFERYNKKNMHSAMKNILHRMN